MTLSPVIVGAAALAAGVAGGLMLRQAWRRAPQRHWWIIGGWALMLGSLIAAAPLFGPARGPFSAVALLSCGVLALVVFGVQIRDPKDRAPREAALEPSDRASKAWRGWLRVLLAGPIGGIAAMGVGLAYTVWVPGEPQTRMVVGGLLVPFLWAGGMAWTLSDDKILRATAVLVGVTVVTFTASALRGFS